MITSLTHIYTLAPPDNLGISHIDIGLIQLTFEWSPVAPDCPAIRYNILASNCGSCPTTTNHTIATCINVPSNGSTCAFAVQTVICEDVTGNKSDLVSIVVKNTSSSHAEMHENSSTDTIRMASVGFLVTSLVVCITGSTTVIVIVLNMNKAKIKAVLNDLLLKNRETTAHGSGGESMYDDVTDPAPRTRPVSAINTRKNVAYGHTLILSTVATDDMKSIPT